MLLLADKPLEFARIFVNQVDAGLQTIEGAKGLTNIQKKWITFCILAIALTNTICWNMFERVSLGTYQSAAISWMFCKSNICWQFLLQASVKVILKRYGIKKGVLGIDDTDCQRAKQTTKIYHAHKVKDKKTGGYFNGQSLVFIVLITELLTIPVGFKFYRPDPALSAWNKSDKELRKQGVPKKERPQKPERSSDYPTKQEIALELLENFKKQHPEIEVKCVLADALYGTKDFMQKAKEIYKNTQIISQLRKSINVRINNKTINLEKYFASIPPQKAKIKIRGGEEVAVTMKSKRVFVCCHGQKYLIIALKYEGEEEYTYIVASDLSWLARTVVEAFTLRWLVEVFFSDWKWYEGWDKMAKQPGKEGSERSLILSLLLDHCLLLHPIQEARIENKLPACTVGSLLERIKVDCLFLFIQDLINSDNPHERLAYFMQYKNDIFKPACSDKHMSHRDLGHLGPNPVLKAYYKYVESSQPFN